MKDPLSPADFEALEKEYKDLLPILDAFCNEVAHQVNQLLKTTDVLLGFPIQQRVKTWESVFDKINRLPRFNKLRELQDLVGFRIILLFQRDVDTIVKLIQNNFTIYRQYDSQERLKEDQFGYSSKHLVVELKDQWLAVPSFTQMGGLRAEIQVRTVAQHIWAEASHKFQYKNENNIPPAVRRSISRVSALLEIVDLEFERVLETRESYRNLAVHDSAKMSDEKLNVDLLETILDAKLPHASKSPNEDYATLLSNLFIFETRSKQELTNLIDKHINTVLLEDKKKANDLLSEHNSGNQILPQYLLLRARKNVYLSHSGLIRQILRLEYGEKADEYFNNA